MPSKSLVQFSVDGQGCVPSLFFVLRPNYGRDNDTTVSHCQPTLLPETPAHSQASLAQSLVGSLLLSPGPCAYKVCCVLQESVFLGGLSPLPDLQLEESIVGPRTFATVQELICYNCSPVCGMSAWWLYGGA